MPFKYYGRRSPGIRKNCRQVACAPHRPAQRGGAADGPALGAPNQPVVKVGDTVKMGQLIGATDAPISAPVHASVSGKVTAVEPRRHMLGDM